MLPNPKKNRSVGCPIQHFYHPSCLMTYSTYDFLIAIAIALLSDFCLNLFASSRVLAQSSRPITTDLLTLDEIPKSISQYHTTS